ncbi:PAS domain-containing methyl-accepting chemotaxis protein [Fulvimarina sp. MAC8]|uniref:methyl-accepting chemotaxis protein n=1 Tax=Fulvimarina sp. MAC8 TaxID=3162874 RepID=UPI0032EB4AA4
MKFFGSAAKSNASAVLDALSKSLAIAEFNTNGELVTANEIFCRILGYNLNELKGKNHKSFITPEEASSREYKDFWPNLARGQTDAGEFQRIGKSGKEIWMQASYNPIKNKRGEVIGVVKQATDITDERRQRVETEAKMAALSRIQAVIEFLPSGEIITANENFLSATGYKLNEIVGSHHRMFMEPQEAQSPDYVEFWLRLNRGEPVTGDFRRIGKGAREVWLYASYNPVFGPCGKIVKIVKFASDVTERVRAVTAISTGLSLLAQNDLTCRLEQPFSSTFEPLRQDFNASITQIASTMNKILQSSDGIRRGTEEISVAADDLSRRTETQAASLEETAAALNEITSTVKKTAVDASQANNAVSTARTDAVRSGEIVGNAIAAMDSIESSSRQIERIIGVIDEIAFQTNLLALNAGVEAARAGEAGRGFAVVASEVRGLAQRSAEAAKEIKTLISTSGEQVGLGVKLVKETGSALERIVEQINNINSLVSNMANSVQEQSTGLGEVNVAVGQMDKVTQQNAAMVEETAAASRSLADETVSLNEAVSQFRMDKNARQQSVRKDAPVSLSKAKDSKTVVAMKTVGRGGAQPKPRAVAETESWEEF